MGFGFFNKEELYFIGYIVVFINFFLAVIYVIFEKGKFKPLGLLNFPMIIFLTLFGIIFFPLSTCALGSMAFND